MGKSVKEGVMPKEFINNRWFGQTARAHTPEDCGSDRSSHDMTKCPGVERPLDSAAVKVGWEKEHEHVELAVCEMVDGMFIEHGWETETEGQSGPRYIQMDRAGLNRLIKTLRKARDDAFGRDE